MLSATAKRKATIVITSSIVGFLFIYALLGFNAFQFSSFVKQSKPMVFKSAPSKARFRFIPGARRQTGTKGILTRYGFISLNSVSDESFLSKGETLMVSNYFILDYFDEAGNGTSSNQTNKIRTLNDARKPKLNTTKEVRDKWLPICPIIPPDLNGPIKRMFEDESPPTFAQTAKANPEVKMGGRYKPENCETRSKIAIIIPLRGRETQLRVLLANMHPVWQRQQIEYTVYTISQIENGHLFNKAKLLNAGFLEASKDADYDCYVFHDVDMMLEDDRCLYRCSSSDNPRELSVYLDKFDYQELKYHLRCRPNEYPESVFAKYFGGVSMMTKNQIYDVNGYSNLFWGWGSEDIDMYLRLWQRGYYVTQPYGRRCSYHMIKHDTESSNAANEGRFALLSHAISRMRYEGLTSLRYKLLSREEHQLYTNITLDVGKPLKKYEEFMATTYDTFEESCRANVPWD